MANVLEGQLSALDLLIPASERPAANIWWSMTSDRPTPEIPWHCTACGYEITTWFGFIAHDGVAPISGPRVCSPMHMARSHIKARVSLIRRAVAGEDAFYCCMHADQLHGGEIRDPSAMQHADHLRVEIDQARDTWGVRAHAFDEWLGPYLIEQRVFRYSLDPAEYPEEFENDLKVNL